MQNILKYGDRRFLRKEHWFEKKRWEFLDELITIYSKDELDVFMQKYLMILSENFKIYESLILSFVNDLKKTQLAQSTISE
jgi:hypothetical protein